MRSTATAAGASRFQGTGDVARSSPISSTASISFSANPRLPLRRRSDSAGNLASSFQTTARNLELQRSNIDQSGPVGQSNQHADATDRRAEPADWLLEMSIRTRRAHQPAHGKHPATSQLIDVRVVTNESSISLTTANGAALVATPEFCLSTRSILLASSMSTPGSDITASFPAAA